MGNFAENLNLGNRFRPPPLEFKKGSKAPSIVSLQSGADPGYVKRGPRSKRGGDGWHFKKKIDAINLESLCMGHKVKHVIISVRIVSNCSSCTRGLVIRILAFHFFLVIVLLLLLFVFAHSKCSGITL